MLKIWVEMFGIFKNLFGKDPLLEEICTMYGLEYKEHPSPVISQSAAPKAWIGYASGYDISIRHLGYWELLVGEMFPVVDLVLTRLKSGEVYTPPPNEPDSEIQITQLEPEVAEKFKLGIGVMEPEFLGPQLRDSKVKAALLKFSNAVENICIYRRGVELKLIRKKMDRSSFDSDLNAAVEIARHLQQKHPVR